jgi:hypothetical protein
MSTPQTKIYRVYCYNGVSKELSNDLIEASSDDEAIAKANAANFGTKCELWDGDRLVAQLESRAA